MGFFSFLSRRSHDKGKPNNVLKSQNYNTTSSGALPVQGPYPVTGNGPNLLETLTRSRPEFSQTHTSLATDHEGPAPSPAVPRFREESVERPSTAPNGTNSGLSWNSYSTRLKKPSSRGAPPVSFRMFNRGSVAQEVRPSSRGTDKAVSILQPATATPSLVAGHSRANSIRSENGRGFKDILDAQSEIRPADFRTRVKAAGARDYGEDVADRNIGQNGFNLEAPQVQAFYAQCSSTPSFPRASKSENPLGQAERRASSYTTGTRTRSLTSSTQFPFFNKLGAQSTMVRSIQPLEGTPYDALISTAAENITESRRRQSVNTFMPAPQARGERSHSVDQTARFYPSGKRRDSVRPATPSEHPVGKAIRPPSPRPSTATPILPDQPLITKQGPFRPTIFPRDSVLLAKQRTDKTTPNHVLDEANFSGGHSSRKERSFSLRSSSIYSSRSLVASPSATGSPRKRHSLHTLQSSISSPAASRETPTTPSQSPPLASIRQQQSPSPARPSTGNGKQNGHDEMPLIIPSIPIEGAAPKASRASATIDKLIPSLSSLEPSTSPDTHVVDQETGSATSPVETKTRSLRALSASSATATVSDASSNPFQRPHSRHTANTSVDLSAPSLKTTSRTSLHTPPLAVIEATIPALPTNLDLDANTTTAAGESPIADTNNFNIDDYLSSDDDSITGSRRPRGEGEEDLLFNDSGYGADGMQLPGLFDSLALTSASRQSSQQRLQRHSSSPTFSRPRSSGGRRAIIYTGDSFGRAAGRRYIIDTGAVDDEEEDREYEYDNDSDSYSDAVAYPVEEDENDADSLYSNRRSSAAAAERRRESGAGIRSPPLLQPSRVINRLSAIVHPYHPQHPNNRPVTPNSPANKTAVMTTSTTPISRPSPRATHLYESPRHDGPNRSQTRHVDKEIIEEVEERGDGDAMTMITRTTTKGATPATTTTISTQEITTSSEKGVNTTTKETTINTKENEKPPNPKPTDLVYRVSDISAAMKLRKETKARNRAAGGVGTGATKMSNKSRWSIATSIHSNVSGGVTTTTTTNSNKTNGDDDGLAAPTLKRNKSVSSTTSKSSVGRANRAKKKAAAAVTVNDVMDMDDTCVRDAKGKRDVQVGVHEVGLGLRMEEKQRERVINRRRADEEEDGNQADVECV